jgi:hypothetical protein
MSQNILKNKLTLLDSLKEAYPNYEQFFNYPGAYDTQKWLEAIKTVYYLEKNGLDRSSAIQRVTADWKVTEVNDFRNWLRFYEEGNHLKYKVAQFYYGNADVGYLLPIKKDPDKQEQVSGKDIDFARDAAADEMSNSEKKRLIEKLRNKLLGRLDSAEKLLRSSEGQLFASEEHASLLETIYNLKKKVQLVNKKSSSTKLYDDMIVREANILSRKGFYKAAEMLYSLADEAPKPKDSSAPLPAPPAPPAQGSGNVGGLPTMAPGSPQIPPPNNTIDPTKKPVSEPVKKFLEGLDNGNITTDTNSLEVNDADDELIVEAQLAEPLPKTDEPAAPVAPINKSPELSNTTIPKEKPLEVKEEDILKEPSKELSKEPPKSNGKDFDNIINSVFANITIGDIVSKLEDVANFYKTREMPRQLALVDMMLDSAGLASFFPSLAEATNKALEANNYISTRIEDVLSKLRGTMTTKEIDTKEHKTTSPELEKTKQLLQQQNDKEKEKKQLRKDLEEKALEDQTKETPEIEIEEDLSKPIEEPIKAAPTKIPIAPPTVPAKPAAPPVV